MHRVGRAALVTGAARGVGEAVARRLAAEGSALVLADRDAEGLERVAAGLGEVPVRTIDADLADPTACRAAVAACEEAHGRLDVVVASTGRRRPVLLHGQAEADWAEPFGAQWEAQLGVVRAALPAMRRAASDELASGSEPARRSICLLTSATAATGEPGTAAEAAGAGAAGALVRVLSREAGPLGITVNAVAPGVVDTPRHALRDGPDAVETAGEGAQAAERELARASIALGRLGTAEEVAAVVAFLVGPEATYVTGAVVPVTGGLAGALQV